MPNYAIYNDQGDILRTITVPEEALALQLSEGEHALECDARPHHRIDVATLQVIEIPEEQPHEDTREEWVKERARLYPAIGKQLDMLWHAMDSGEIPRAAQFYEALKRVKDLVPKGDATTPVVIYEMDQIPPEDTV